MTCGNWGLDQFRTLDDGSFHRLRLPRWGQPSTGGRASQSSSRMAGATKAGTKGIYVYTGGRPWLEPLNIEECGTIGVTSRPADQDPASEIPPPDTGRPFFFFSSLEGDPGDEWHGSFQGLSIHELESQSPSLSHMQSGRVSPIQSADAWVPCSGPPSTRSLRTRPHTNPRPCMSMPTSALSRRRPAAPRHPCSHPGRPPSALRPPAIHMSTNDGRPRPD